MVDDSTKPLYRTMIREMPAAERPRERLLHYGERSLSTAELLAIILRVGMQGTSAIDLAQHVLKEFHGLAGLARASCQELCTVRGLSVAKVAQIKAALELGRRLQMETPQERPQILSPQDAAQILLPEMQYLDQENLKVITLDTKHRVVEAPTIYKGSLNASMVRLAEVFRDAIRANCAAILLAHNHPSGDPTPSREDLTLTKEVVKAGRLLDIEVLDHLIIGHQRYISLKEQDSSLFGP